MAKARFDKSQFAVFDSKVDDSMHVVAWAVAHGHPKSAIRSLQAIRRRIDAAIARLQG